MKKLYKTVVYYIIKKKYKFIDILHTYFICLNVFFPIYNNLYRLCSITKQLLVYYISVLILDMSVYTFFFITDIYFLMVMEVLSLDKIVVRINGVKKIRRFLSVYKPVSIDI